MSNLDLTDVRSIIQSLKDGIKEYRDAGKFKEMLDNMVKFYQYSFNNQMLILAQKPDATYCGSLKFWNGLGRYVEKFLYVKNNNNITMDFLAENGFV